MSHLLCVCLRAVLLLPLLPLYARAQAPTLVYNLQDYFKIVQRENPDLKLGLEVRELDESQKPVFTLNERTPFIPASVLKVLTSYAALKILGGNYRFPTEVFLDHLPREIGGQGEEKVDFTQPPTKVGNLYVRGYGDPTFDDHRMADLALAVRRYGVEQVDDVVIDDTLFMDAPRATGDKPHEAGLSAVALNFNSYSLAVAPGPLGGPAQVSLAPGLPFSLTNHARTVRGATQDIEILQLPSSTAAVPGADDQDRIFLGEKAKVAVTVQGSVGHASSGQTYFRSVPDIPEYFAAMLKFNLEHAGVQVRGAVRRGETPAAAKLLQTIESEELAGILQQLNHTSNNIVAGQLVFAIGQDANGYFRYDRGLARLRSTLESTASSAEGFEIFDGSGLDKRNRVTPEQIVSILAAAYRNFSIAPDFIASLSRFGHSGTLKTRELLESETALRLRGAELEETRARASGVWGKTGTLDGVSSLAGYAETDTGTRVAFAVLLNGVPDKDHAIQIENDLGRILVGLPVAALKPKSVPQQPPAQPQRPPLEERPQGRPNAQVTAVENSVEPQSPPPSGSDTQPPTSGE